jgi:hypothetical protein
VLTGTTDGRGLRMTSNGKVVVFGLREFSGLMARSAAFAGAIAKQLAGRVLQEAPSLSRAR